MRRPYEQKIVNADGVGELNQQNRDSLSSDFVRLNLRTKKNGFKLLKTENNAVLLSGEDHVFGTEINGTRFDGVPGATNSKNPQIFSVDVTTIFGVDFTKTILVKTGASCIFNNCRFAGTIDMETNSKATFIGCYFYSNGAVNNVGVPINAIINGCIRKSGIGHVNVTIISETV